MGEPGFLVPLLFYGSSGIGRNSISRTKIKNVLLSKTMSHTLILRRYYMEILENYKIAVLKKTSVFNRLVATNPNRCKAKTTHFTEFDFHGLNHSTSKIFGTTTDFGGTRGNEMSPSRHAYHVYPVDSKIKSHVYPVDSKIKSHVYPVDTKTKKKRR
jgi:hypothetical protein